MALVEPIDVNAGETITAALWNAFKGSLFDAIGDQVHTENNVVLDANTVTENIDALDIAFDNIITDASVQFTANKTFSNNLGLIVTAWGTNADGVIGVGNGTAPTTAPVDMVQLYAKDFAGGDSRLYVKSETGSDVIIGGGAVSSTTLIVTGSSTLGTTLVNSSGTISTGGETSPDCDPGGITIKHGGNGFGFTIKQSSISHGGGQGVDSDTYFIISKDHATQGGARITGLADLDGSDGLVLIGKTPIGATFSKSVIINGQENDGTAIEDTMILLSIQNAGTGKISIMGTGGILLGSPTGGDKGMGTLNAQIGVYDEGVELTCYPLEQYLTGTIDLDFWDSVSPKKYHKNAHDFFNKSKYLDLQTNINFWTKEGYLPTMPSRKDWKHNTLSSGEIINMLMETLDLHAVHFKELNDKLIANNIH